MTFITGIAANSMRSKAQSKDCRRREGHLGSSRRERMYRVAALWGWVSRAAFQNSFRAWGLFSASRLITSCPKSRACTGVDQACSSNRHVRSLIR